MPVVKHLTEKAHVIVPTYPGWDGTPRRERLDSVANSSKGLRARRSIERKRPTAHTHTLSPTTPTTLAFDGLPNLLHFRGKRLGAEGFPGAFA